MPDADTAAFFNEVNKLSSVPGVKKFEILREISPKNPYEYGISMEFTDQSAYDNYSGHPDHVRFVEDIWVNTVSEFLEIDYLIPD